MNKTDLIKKVAKETKVNEATVRLVFNSVVETIKNALLYGLDVKIKDFMNLTKEVRPAMRRKNPQNGEWFDKPKHFYIKISLPTVFKKKVKNQTVY